MVIVDVLEVDLGAPDGVPALPGDAEDDQCDHQADDRVRDLNAEADHKRRSDDAERDEAVHARVLAVGDERRALLAVAGAQPYLGCELVAEKADHTCGGEQP